MHWYRPALILELLFIAAIALVSCPATTASDNIPVSNMTITFSEIGAVHFKIVQTVASSRDGATTFHFELQKQYRPENVSIYDYETGKPLKYQMKDLESVAAYDVSFDRPYFNGYTFVVEYDNHNHIIDEGGGTYSFGMRPGVDINKVERIYTVILPPQNFTYIGYNTALDRPISVDTVDGSTVIVFHNITSAPADYAWEIKFRAIGIKNELEKANTGPGVSLDGGMTLIVSLVSLAVCIRFKKR